MRGLFCRERCQGLLRYTDNAEKGKLSTSIRTVSRSLSYRIDHGTKGPLVVKIACFRYLSTRHSNGRVERSRPSVLLLQISSDISFCTIVVVPKLEIANGPNVKNLIKYSSSLLLTRHRITPLANSYHSVPLRMWFAFG